MEAEQAGELPLQPLTCQEDVLSAALMRLTLGCRPPPAMASASTSCAWGPGGSPLTPGSRLRSEGLPRPNSLLVAAGRRPAAEHGADLLCARCRPEQADADGKRELMGGFTFAYAGEQVAAARGLGGGIALFARTTPSWQMSKGIGL